MATTKTIFITGASSGIGKACAHYFSEQGWAVAATMRNPEAESELSSLPHVTVHRLDVTDDTTIAAARDQALAHHGSIDVVLNNAGYALMGPFEGASPAQIERQFATNVFGVMNVTRAFLPYFRANGRGLFLNVSSIGGVITFPMMSLYHASKWAVEGFSESLSYELGQLGIGVKLIEPGGVATNFGGTSMSRGAEPLDGYDEVAGTFWANLSKLNIETSTAKVIAAGIYEAATDGSDRLRYVLGPDAERFASARSELGSEAYIADKRLRIFGSSSD